MKTFKRGASLLVSAWLAQGCASSATREDIDSLVVNGTPYKVESTFSIGYSVATNIKAPAERVWNILVDAPEYPRWNSTVVGIEGKIRSEENIILKSKVAPDRDFKLKVSEFEPNKRMVWEDGTSGIFKGLRTYALVPQKDGSTNFSMIERFAGVMLPMIKGSLPDFNASFRDFAADLKRVAEASI